MDVCLNTCVSAAKRKAKEKAKAKDQKEGKRGPDDDDADDIDSDDEDIEVPSFGRAADTDISGFYQFWNNFYTRRPFQWCDKWKLSDAPSRHVRRLMTRDNLKERKAGKQQVRPSVRACTLIRLGSN